MLTLLGLVIASCLMIIAYALEAAAIPFPVFVVVYFFIGYGGSFLVRRPYSVLRVFADADLVPSHLQNSGSNVFLANVSVGKASRRFGILHGVYGMSEDLNLS